MSADGLPGWYLPAEGHLWDPWFFRSGEVVHLFHLLQPTPAGTSRERPLPRDRPVIAHATWTGRDGWIPRGIAIDHTGTAYDADRIHTGCVIRDGEAFAMLYSGSNRFVCLARSPDLDHWTKAAENPVLSPDPRRYRERWRDPWIVDGPTGAPHTVVIAAQAPGPAVDSATGAVGVVAVAHSADLVDWDQDAPLGVPAWFEWLEVPELHEIDGTWYLLFATRRQWITAAGLDAFRSCGLAPIDGAYCLTAPTWRGPYGSLTAVPSPSPSPSMVGAPDRGYTTRLFEGAPGERWLWSHVEHGRDAHAVFGLQPPRRVSIVEGVGIVPRQPDAGAVPAPPTQG